VLLTATSEGDHWADIIDMLTIDTEARQLTRGIEAAEQR
jgi:hypothetical protein